MLLSPLTLAPQVLRPPLDFIATEGARSAAGLVASIQASNGTVLVARLVKLLDPNDRMAFAEEVAAVGSMTSSCVATALLELVNGVEVALRQVTHRAKPRRPGGSQPRSGPGPAEDRLPQINAANQDLPVIAHDAWTALLAANDPPRLFVQGRGLVRLEGNHDGALIPVDLTRERLRYELARVAVWQIPKETGFEVVLPPMWVVDDMLARPEPPLPPLTRITEVPVFTPDGHLQTELGYHVVGRTFYAPPPGLTVPVVPERPVASDIECAKALIFRELLNDFPFVARADQAHAIGLFILRYVRDMIQAPTPNHLIEAPGAGAGKGLLADILLRPAVGPHLGLVTEARDEDEWRKRLTARPKEARAVVLLDNIRRSLDSAQLAAALTAHYWEDRLLGKSETIAVPVRCVWVTTGNNPVLSTELARRCVRIRLDPEMDRPWLRTGFAHPDLRAWVDGNRGNLIWAALTLAQHWIARGRPKPTVRPLGSYEAWSTVVGGIIEAAVIAGFLEHLQEFYEIADHEGAIWRAFVDAWWDKFGTQEVGTSELFPLASALEGFDLGDRSERGQRAAFGKQLGKQRDRVIGCYRVTFVGTAQRAKRWCLLPTDREEAQ